MSIQTRFSNISGAARYFGYLPPHGQDLAASQSILIKGDLLTLLAAKTDKQGLQSFIADENNGIALAVVHQGSSN